MNPPSHALVAEADSILTVTLNRPDKLNAISPEITAVLWQAVRAVAERDDLRALVITGTGRFFTAGIDLAAPSAATRAEVGSQFRRLYREHHLLYDEIEALEKPVFLAAQGPCLGAGLEMAASCDFRIASDTAYFQLPEVALATIAGSGGISRVTRLVGVHWAKWIAMANRKVSAAQALQIGLVHEVFAVDGFHDRVHELVIDIIKLPREALGASKLAIDMVAETDRATARNIERVMNTTLIFSDEFAQATERFTSKDQG
ncbi:MAG: acyl-CoA hydratase [Subtercola sp.]|nr:acyl-CoA hydratase [Subtercola sp.]